MNANGIPRNYSPTGEPVPTTSVLPADKPSPYTSGLRKFEARRMVRIMVSGEVVSDRDRILSAVRATGSHVTLSESDYYGPDGLYEPGYTVAMWADAGDIVEFLDRLHGELGKGRCALVDIGNGRAMCSRVLVDAVEVLA